MTVVLFACIHNAGRSQMAAAFFNHIAAADRARAISAGTSPGPAVHPEVIRAMAEVHIDLSSVQPQRLTPALAASVQLLITMGCGEVCPELPGLRRADWPLDDPKGQPVERVRQIRDEVERRIRRLVADEGWATPAT